MTSTETRTWQIIDLSDGEVAGTAPGTDQESALYSFRRDALEGAGTIAFDTPGTGQPCLIHEGTRFGAQIETSALQPGANARAIMDADRAPADLENGPSPQDAVDAIADRIEAGELISDKSMSDRDFLAPLLDEQPSALERVDALTDQLHEARLELQRLDNDRRITRDSYTETGAAVDLDTIAQLSRDAAVQRRHVRQLERALEEARTAAIEHQPAHPASVRFDLIDEENAKRGLPVTLDEAGDLGFATVLWDKATTALEAASDHDPTNREVAQRVADTYATLWIGDAPGRWPAPTVTPAHDADTRN